MQETDLTLYSFVTGYAVPVVQSTVVIAAAWFVRRLVTRALGRMAASGYLTDSLHYTAASAVKGLLVVVVVLLMLGFFGVSVTALWAAFSGVAALIAVGFVAMWSVLSNVSCSILLVVFAPFRIGDTIEIQDPTVTVIIRGRVIGMNMMFTTLKAIDEDGNETDQLLRIPNTAFFQRYTRILPGRGVTSLQKYLADQHQQG